MIFLDVHMPAMNGFEFLNKFNSTKGNEQYFKVCFTRVSKIWMIKIMRYHFTTLFNIKPRQLFLIG